MGIMNHEAAFLRLVDKLTNGTQVLQYLYRAFWILKFVLGVLFLSFKCFVTHILWRRVIRKCAGLEIVSFPVGNEVIVFERCQKLSPKPLFGSLYVVSPPTGRD